MSHIENKQSIFYIRKKENGEIRTRLLCILIAPRIVILAFKLVTVFLLFPQRGSVKYPATSLSASGVLNRIRYTPFPSGSHLLKQSRDAGQDVDVAVDDVDGDPEVVGDEDDLVLVRQALVVGELDHAQLGAAGGRVFVPGEVGLAWVGLGEALHALVGLLVQHDGQGEGLGDGLVGDVVVGGADAARGHDHVVVVAHAARGLDNLGFIVGDDLDTLQVDAEREAILGEPGAVAEMDDLFVGEDVATDLPTQHLVADDYTSRRVDGPLAPFGCHGSRGCCRQCGGCCRAMQNMSDEYLSDAVSHLSLSSEQEEEKAFKTVKK
ncbi:Molybdopterin binding protein [Hortaea werneckii]|nr:Molybdopterin binding protein [Hortaea werneckii]